jgi:polyhydroxyalkanoate synthesis regulator phasin
MCGCSGHGYMSKKKKIEFLSGHLDRLKERVSDLEEYIKELKEEKGS